MKTSKLAKKVWTGALTLCVASFAVALPVSAQAPGDTTGTTGTGTGTTATAVEEDDGFDWGLLGLLGLLGLAGLARRNNNEEPTRYRAPHDTTTTPPSRIDPNR
jgi:hypothetical protein